MITRRGIIIGISAATVGCVAGSVVTYFLMIRYVEDQIWLEQQRAQETLEAFRGFYVTQTTVLSGEVQLVDYKERHVTLRTEPVLNPFDRINPIRVVIFEDDVQIFERTPKDEQLFKAELDDYERRAARSSQALARPLAFLLREADFNRIKVGDYLQIEAAEDISQTTEIVPTKVEIQYIDGPIR